MELGELLIDVTVLCCRAGILEWQQRGGQHCAPSADGCVCIQCYAQLQRTQANRQLEQAFWSGSKVGASTVRPVLMAASASSGMPSCREHKLTGSWSRHSGVATKRGQHCAPSADGCVCIQCHAKLQAGRGRFLGTALCAMLQAASASGPALQGGVVEGARQQQTRDSHVHNASGCICHHIQLQSRIRDTT